MVSTKKISNAVLSSLLVCITATFFPSALMGTEKDIPQESDTSAMQTKMEGDAFEYVWEGRPDPFKPFIEPKVASNIDLNAIVEEDKKLTGMQLFEPGQLTLVAVMGMSGKKIAMVEDDTGKGYVINEGMLIGRNGVVSQITQDNDVIITETAQTRAGREIVTTVVMRLNKEGDQ